VEWRGQQHAREAVESTASGATSTTQDASLLASLSAARMKKDMEESHTGLIKASRSKHPQKSSVFQCSARVKAVAVQLQE